MARTPIPSPRTPRKERAPLKMGSASRPPSYRAVRNLALQKIQFASGSTRVGARIFGYRLYLEKFQECAADENKPLSSNWQRFAKNEFNEAVKEGLIKKSEVFDRMYAFRSDSDESPRPTPRSRAGPARQAPSDQPESEDDAEMDAEAEVDSEHTVDFNDDQPASEQAESPEAGPSTISRDSTERLNSASGSYDNQGDAELQVKYANLKAEHDRLRAELAEWLRINQNLAGKCGDLKETAKYLETEMKKLERCSAYEAELLTEQNQDLQQTLYAQQSAIEFLQARTIELNDSCNSFRNIFQNIKACVDSGDNVTFMNPMYNLEVANAIARGAIDCPLRVGPAGPYIPDIIAYVHEAPQGPARWGALNANGFMQGHEQPAINHNMSAYGTYTGGM